MADLAKQRRALRVKDLTDNEYDGLRKAERRDGSHDVLYAGRVTVAAYRKGIIERRLRGFHSRVVLTEEGKRLRRNIKAADRREKAGAT